MKGSVTPANFNYRNSNQFAHVNLDLIIGKCNVYISKKKGEPSSDILKQD